MVEMEYIGDKAVSLARKLGCEHCDVVVSEISRCTAEIEKMSVKQADSLEDSGVGFRAFIEGSSGFAYCSGHKLRAVEKAVRQAIALAKAGTRDPDFKDLPTRSKPKRASCLFDAKLVSMEPEDVVRIVMELAESAAYDKRISSVNATATAASGDFHLANSNGLSASQKMTSFEIGAESVVKSGGEMFSGYDVASSRRLDSELIPGVGKSACEHALRGLVHTKMETGDYPVVVDPLAAGWLLAAAIGHGADADAVQRKRSYLAGQIGKTVGSRNLTVLDDPALPWGFGSYSFDGEGTPGMTKPIVERGILRTYLYDSYTAGKDSVASTGNGSRGHSLWSYRQPPVISSSNLVVKPGTASTDEIIRDTRDGVYLRLTFDYPNMATGELSGLMMESYRIEKGRIGPSIRQATIGIGLIDMFSRIDLVGRETRYAFGVSAPPLRVSSARIAGAG